MKKLATGAVIALLALGAWAWLRPPAFEIRPNPDRNVLLVTIDTLRADTLGCDGGRATTPNIDRLAAQGVRFSFTHAHAVVTLVSHASILTGRYPYEHGIRDNTGYRLSPSQPTAATLLKAAGFATGAFIGGFPLDHRFGLAVGFDEYDDRLGADVTDAEAGDRERRADAVVASALDWIGRQHGKWFGWVHLYDPHAPYRPPPEWASRYPSDPYLGEVSWTDAALGVLLDRLAGQPRPTLVVVTGDHGESLGEHGELTHSIFAYESTLHVPLVISEIDSPERRRGAPVTIDTPVRHVDVLPTLLDLAGAPIPAALPGASLRPVIARHDRTDRPSYFEAMTPTITRGWAPLRGVIAGRQKYIDLPIPELYDLARDPAEGRNLANERADRVRVLTNTLRMFNVAPPARAQTESADTVERLRSLGYIGGGSAPARETYTDADDPKRLIVLEQTLDKAAAAYRAGRADEAVRLYTEVIARRPDTEDAYRKLALVYWRAGRQREAVETLESALRHGVMQAEVRVKLAQYLADSGQPERAIALLERETGEDPDVLLALGNAYEVAGRLQDASREFTQLLQVDPNNALAYENLGVTAMHANDFVRAESSLRRAVALDPRLAGAHTSLGVVLASTGRRGEAIDAWKRAIDLDPTDVNALYNLTVSLVDAGRRDEARTYGERFIVTAPPSLQEDVAAIRRLLTLR